MNYCNLKSTRLNPVKELLEKYELNSKDFVQKHLKNLSELEKIRPRTAVSLTSKPYFTCL